MAANVDLLVTVTSLANPPPRLVTLDQLLAFAELEDIAAAVVLTKPDLAERRAREELCRLYRDARSIPRSSSIPRRGENVEALRELIRGRRALLAGNSGVGQEHDLPRARRRRR